MEHFEAAQALWARALRLGQRRHSALSPGDARGVRALLLLELGRVDDAERQLARAFDAAQGLGAHTRRRCSRTTAAAVCTRAGMSPQRSRRIASPPKARSGRSISRSSSGRSRPRSRAQVGSTRRRGAWPKSRGDGLDAARSCRALRATRSPRPRERRCRRCAPQARAGFGPRASASRSHDERRTACARDAERCDRGTPRSDGPLALEVAGDARRGSRSTVVGHPSISALRKRLLKTLVDARLKSPGRALAVEEVCRAVWPGRRMLAKAARRRVRVAVSTLRALGLRDALRTTSDGYLLDADTPLRYRPD